MSARSYAARVFDAKQRIVLEALRGAGGNVSKAAAALGIERSKLYRLLRDLRITIHRTSTFAVSGITCETFADRRNPRK